LEKGPIDRLFSPNSPVLKIEHESIVGTGRRCAGQGDLLAGSLASLLLLSQNEFQLPELISFACALIRRANEIAFQQFGWSTITSDIVKCIPQAFKELF
jgi:ATP-dependent NAD(P)H-hydrate dehydratase